MTSSLIQSHRTCISDIHAHIDALAIEIAEDAPVVARVALSTPLIQISWLSTEKRRVWAKLECQQRTGSFKIRGAYNALRKLPRSTTVFTASAGNHGLALATMAKELGMHARIFVPLAASEVKVRRLLAAGADVVPVGQDVAEATRIAVHQAIRSNGHYISPFDHSDVVIGQGSLAWDIDGQHSGGFNHVLLPFGGGGLLTGFGCAARSLWPDVKLHAVLPSVFGRQVEKGFQGNEMTRSVIPTIADGLAIQHEQDNWLWPYIGALVDRFHTVDESTIKTAMLSLLNHESLLCEGAGAIGLAPLLLDETGRDELTGDVLVVLSGGNLSTSILSKALAAGIEDHQLRRLNGLRGTALGIELPQNATVPGASSAAIPGAFLAVESTGSHHWQRMAKQLAEAADALSSVIARHREYALRENLRLDPVGIEFAQDTLTSLGRTLEDCASPLRTRKEVTTRYRLALQQYGLARSALSWCSASNDQSGEIMFFDPAELQAGAVNYDRYGTPPLRELELHLVETLGFDPLRQTVLMTSSGQAAYSTLESFLLREVLAENPRVSTAPYIYFEAFEQLSALPHMQVSVAEDWSLDALIECVEHNDSQVIFLDPMANLAQMPTLDLAELATRLLDRDWRHRWLAIDGTMVSAGFDPFSLFQAEQHPRILYYESASKYLQFGLDIQMAGVIVCDQAHAPTLSRHRRNLGTVLYQSQVARFPLFQRRDLLERLGCLTRNAQILASTLRELKHPRTGLLVAYPDRWRDLGWAHGGGVVAVTFADSGLNNRPCLDVLIELLIERCRNESLDLTKGVSFGFGTTRVSAAAAIAADTDPFLRFSVGEESPDDMYRLAALVRATVADYLNTF